MEQFGDYLSVSVLLLLSMHSFSQDSLSPASLFLHHLVHHRCNVRRRKLLKLFFEGTSSRAQKAPLTELQQPRSLVECLKSYCNSKISQWWLRDAIWPHSPADQKRLFHSVPPQVANFKSSELHSHTAMMLWFYDSLRSYCNMALLYQYLQFCIDIFVLW